MQEFYKKRLIILAIILVLLGTISVFYSLWKIDNSNIMANTTSCVDIIYSDELTYNLVNPPCPWLLHIFGFNQPWGM